MEDEVAFILETVAEEMQGAIDHLRKEFVKIRAGKDERQKISDQIIAETKAEFIQSIGQIIVIFRKEQAKTKS